MTQRPQPLTLAEVLGPRAVCSCGRVLDEGDCAWNNGDTGSGTGYSVLNVICLECFEGIVHCFSWYPCIDDYEEFLSVLASEIANNPRLIIRPEGDSPRAE